MTIFDPMRENHKPETIMNKYFFMAVLLGCLGCSDKPQPEATAAPAPDAIRAEIQQLEDYYINALNLKSTYSMKHFYYAEDVRSYSFGKPVLTGIDAVVDNLTQQYYRTRSGTKYRFELKEVNPSTDGMQVVAIGKIFRINVNKTEKLIGNYFGYFEKRNGKYVCVREMETRNPRSEK